MKHRDLFLVVSILLLSQRPIQAMQNSQDSANVVMRTFGLGTTALALRGAWLLGAHLFHQEPDFVEPETDPVVLRQQALMQLERTRTLAAPALSDQNRLHEARIVFLNEDPRRFRDLETFMVILRDMTRAGDIVIFENIYGQEDELIEHHLLTRFLTLRELAADTPLAVLRHWARHFHERLEVLRQELVERRVFPEGVAIGTWQHRGNDSTTSDNIIGRARAQMQAIQNAMHTHKRIFVIRNRAFSIPFMDEFLDVPGWPASSLVKTVSRALNEEHKRLG